MMLLALLALTCANNPDARQLDYWLGRWNVGGGTSVVSLSLDQCLLTEQWDTGRGLKGENVFAYNAEDKKWHGLYIDNAGRVHVLTGTVTPGDAVFEGPSADALNRITIKRVNADSVVQTWEKSSDNGATWKIEFRGVYARLLHLHEQ